MSFCIKDALSAEGRGAYLLQNEHQRGQRARAGCVTDREGRMLVTNPIEQLRCSLDLQQAYAPNERGLLNEWALRSKAPSFKSFTRPACEMRSISQHPTARRAVYPKKANPLAGGLGGCKPPNTTQALRSKACLRAMGPNRAHRTQHPSARRALYRGPKAPVNKKSREAAPLRGGLGDLGPPVSRNN